MDIKPSRVHKLRLLQGGKASEKIKLNEYAHPQQNMLDLLAEVADQIRSGQAKGVVIAVKGQNMVPSVGISGDYLDDPAQVLAVASRINYRANQLVDAALKAMAP